jgi:TPR repeat protein
MMQVMGLGKDEGKAFQFAQRAAHVRHAEAMSLLAFLYLSGTGTERNEPQGLVLSLECIRVSHFAQTTLT